MTVEGAGHADVLDERARALARPLDDRSPAADRELLSMSIGDVAVAVDAPRVREVLAAGDLARLPGAEHLGLGLRNLRGELLVVADLASLLGLVATAPTRQRWVVVLDGGDSVLGVLVDGVDALVRVDTVRPLPSVDGLPAAGLFAGVTAEGLCVIEPDAVFAHTRLTASPDRPGAGAAEPEGTP